MLDVNNNVDDMNKNRIGKNLQNIASLNKSEALFDDSNAHKVDVSDSDSFESDDH